MGQEQAAEDVAGGTETTPAAPAPAAPAQQQQGRRNDKIVPMARETLAKLTREHQEKGRVAALTEIEKKAKSLGYDSVDEMWATLAAKTADAGNNARETGDNREARHNRKKDRNNRPRQQAQQQVRQPQNDAPATSKRDDRRVREFQEKAERERRDRIKAQREREEERAERLAAEGRGELKVLALQTGIKDPDYAVELWTRECEQQRSRMEPGAFEKWYLEASEQKFFEELKTTRPFLFQEVVVLANTGTVQDGKTSPPPGAAQVTQTLANAARKNAREMTREEYHADLKRRGLSIPSA